MLDHYLHTAHSAALQARSINSPLMLAALAPGAEPERISDAEQALAWFEAEHRVLMAATGRALEAGFDTHAWQLVWTLSDFLDMRGRWHDWAVAEQIALAATQRLGDRVGAGLRPPAIRLRQRQDRPLRGCARPSGARPEHPQ